MSIPLFNWDRENEKLWSLSLSLSLEGAAERMGGQTLTISWYGEVIICNYDNWKFSLTQAGTTWSHEEQSEGADDDEQQGLQNKRKRSWTSWEWSSRKSWRSFKTTRTTQEEALQTHLLTCISWKKDLGAHGVASWWALILLKTNWYDASSISKPRTELTSYAEIKRSDTRWNRGICCNNLLRTHPKNRSGHIL